MSSIRRTFYVALALLAAIVLAYSHVWQCDFIDYDDNNHVFDNARVCAGLSVANVWWAFTHFHASQWIPLTWISFMADVSFFGLDPGPMHLVNVALHSVNALLVLGVLWQMTGAFWRSACVAALFALHPINVETVAWITERKSLLNTMLWLLAIACHARYAREGKSVWLVLTTCCMALGIMAKAMIVTLPFTLLLLDAWPLHRISSTTWRVRVLEKLPLFVLSVIGSFVQIRAGMSSGLLWSTEMAPISFRLICAVGNVVKYVESLAYPAKLAIQYPMVLAPQYGLAAAGALGIAVFFIFALKRRKSAPYLLFGGLWFLGTLVPVSGIVRAGDAVFADRYSYVPQIGLFVAAIWSVEALLRSRDKRGAASVAAVAFTVLTFLSAQYVTKWTNSDSLFAHAATTWPESVRAQELAASAYSKAGDMRAAAHYYRASLQIASKRAGTRNSYGIALAMLGEIDAAIAQFRQAAADDPSLLAARFNLGTHLVVQEGGAAEAVAVLQQVLREDSSLSVAHYWVGKALEIEGRYAEATEEYQKRLRAYPSDVGAARALERLHASS